MRRSRSKSRGSSSEHQTGQGDSDVSGGGGKARSKSRSGSKSSSKTKTHPVYSLVISASLAYSLMDLKTKHALVQEAKRISKVLAVKHAVDDNPKNGDFSKAQIEKVRQNPVIALHEVYSIGFNGWPHWTAQLNAKEKEFVNKVRNFHKYFDASDKGLLDRKIVIVNVPVPLSVNGGWIENYVDDFVDALYHRTSHDSLLDSPTKSNITPAFFVEPDAIKNPHTYLLRDVTIRKSILCYHRILKEHKDAVAKAIKNFNAAPGGKCRWNMSGKKLIMFDM